LVYPFRSRKCRIRWSEKVLNPGNSVDVPVGAKHRISCISEGVLVIVEVQTGSSFAEEDIVRYENDFGRSTAS